MISRTLCPVLLLLGCAAAAPAAERHADAAAPVLLADGMPTVPSPRPSEFAAAPVPTSAGVAESLPDVPSPTTVATLLKLQRGLVTDARAVPAANSFSMPLPGHAGPGLLQSGPLAAAAHKVHAKNFNTEDGSSIDAFAICYRLNRRSSLQVIPGDPAPVKMPVTTMANNMGVTVGMVMRLSKQR